ncbi:MAG TPA: MqnA/MqnD/SBP family protein, partial [Candidatus Thalassarchaeaceae archaeon]|nr:MqnA/MqnD/SBP family protein [Candidatus Thalassarchaeaceae archaeon]
MSWENVIGRVAFTNCDPLFYGLDDNWKVLSAPPAWLTGHLLRKDCLTAPIPTADYAKYADELILIPDLGIVSNGAVGSVILFGTRELEQMRDIALPSDSSTSKVLLRWLLNNRELDPKLIESG